MKYKLPSKATRNLKANPKVRMAEGRRRCRVILSALSKATIGKPYTKLLTACETERELLLAHAIISVQMVRIPGSLLNTLVDDSLRLAAIDAKEWIMQYSGGLGAAFKDKPKDEGNPSQAG